MLPADAVIHDAAGLRAALETAFAVAEANPVLATIGIASFPATGYGYIQQADTLGEYASRPVYRVQRFVEKPDLATARIWSRGIISECRYVCLVGEIHCCGVGRSTPSLWASLQAIDGGLAAGTELDVLLAEHYPQLEKISVDYAIIEKAANVVMAESVLTGTMWARPAVARHYPADAAGNVVRGAAHLQESSGNMLFSRRRPSGRSVGCGGSDCQDR